LKIVAQSLHERQRRLGIAVIVEAAKESLQVPCGVLRWPGAAMAERNRRATEPWRDFSTRRDERTTGPAHLSGRGRIPRMTVMENLLLGVPRRTGDSMWSAFGLGRRWRVDEWQVAADARELLKSFGPEKKEDEYAGNVIGGSDDA
jgi:hypothetical protein